MKLETPIIEIDRCPKDILSYLREYSLGLNWDDENYLTKEEAFFNQSYRYEGSTEYFNEEQYFYSNISPSTKTAEGLKIYTDYLLKELFPDHELFRSQVVCLKPGSNIHPHIDPRYYHKYGKRIHLPIQINSNSYHVHFIPENNYNMVFSKMTEGVITHFDNITPHSAFNYGNTNRIHIICDFVKNSTSVKMKEAFGNNPNATNKGILDEYYLHIDRIQERYQCNFKDLKPHYLEKMKEYEHSGL